MDEQYLSIAAAALQKCTLLVVLYVNRRFFTLQQSNDGSSPPHCSAPQRFTGIHSV